MDREEKSIVALMGCSHALSHGFLLIYPAVLLLLGKEFSMDYLKLGIVGNIMSFCYGLGALPAGMIYNRLGPRKLYLVCFLGSALVSILVALSSTIALLTIGLAFLGIFGSLYHPLGNAVITARVREYGRALGIHGATGNLGLATAPFIIGLIASHFGWRWAYFLIALPGMALSLWSLFIPMSSRGEQSPPAPVSTRSPFLQNLKRYFSPHLICLYLMNIMINFSFIGSITFLPTTLAKRTSFTFFSLDQVALGGMLSAIVLFMGVFGQYVGGVLAQRPHLVRWLLLVNLFSLPFVLAMSFTTDLLLMLLGLIFFFLNFFSQPMTNTLLARHTSEGMRGTAFGIFFFAAFCLGSSASSFSGWIAQRFGLQWVFLGISGSVLFLILLSFLLLRIKTPGALSPHPSLLPPNGGRECVG
jgi:MFS family permease